jgi:hypothetical protein
MKSKLLIFLPVILIIYLFYGYGVKDENLATSEGISNATFSICGIAGQWAPSGTFPDVPVGAFYGASVWLNDTLYHLKPRPNGSAYTGFVQYTWNGTWKSGSNIPFSITATALVAAGGKLYSIGGSQGTLTGGTFSANMITYNPALGRWVFPVMEPMPMALAGHSAVVWGDSVIFVIGGIQNPGGSTHLDVHYYRIASNTWGTISNSIPAGQGRRTFGLGIVGNKIIMSGGFNTEHLKSTWVGTIGSNASSITWEAAPDIPLPSNITGLSRCGATTYGDFFFLVNGEKGGSGGFYDATHIFSVSLNQWVGMITDIPFKRSNIFNNVTARCIDDTVSLFIPGGFGSVTGEPPGEATDRFDVTRVGILTGVTPGSTEIPEAYELSQNYPNPFNPVTKINFSIPKSEFVTVKVYDILGKEVATLMNEIRNAGKHSIEFNAINLSSGVYFYRIEAGDFKAVKQMLLLK